jgi:hypothetical protein
LRTDTVVRDVTTAAKGQRNERDRSGCGEAGWNEDSTDGRSGSHQAAHRRHLVSAQPAVRKVRLDARAFSRRHVTVEKCRDVLSGEVRGVVSGHENRCIPFGIASCS